MSNWSPHIEAWQALIYKFLPNARMLYYCFGDGEPWLFSNDPKVKDKYYISISKNEYGIKSLKYATREQTKNILQKVLHTKEEDLLKLRLMCYSTEIEDDLFVEKWDYFPDFYSERGDDNRP